MPLSSPPAAAAPGAGAPVITFILSLAALGFLLYRQRQVREVRASFLLPVLLAALGLAALFAGQGRLTSPAEFGILGALLAGDALGLGVVRAWTVRVWPAGGQVLRQGSWLTVGLWLAGVAIHEAVDLAEHIPGASVLLYLSVTWAVQQLVLLARVRRLGRPEAGLAVVSRPGPGGRDQPAVGRPARDA
jgi:hypothetical protein